MNADRWTSNDGSPGEEHGDAGGSSSAPPHATANAPPLTIEIVRARLAAVVKRQRDAVACAPDIIGWAALMLPKGEQILALVAALREAGVHLREWGVFVRAERARLRDAAFAAEAQERAEAGDLRPDVYVRSDPEYLTNDDAARALGALPDIYERSFSLVEVLRDTRTSAPEIRELPSAIVRDRMTRAARFVQEVEDKDTGQVVLLPCHPPEWCVKATMDRGRWPGARSLRAIVESPAMRPNGTILTEPGYDASTGLLYEPSAEYPPIPECPTRDNVGAALDRLLYLVKDFPFHDAADGWHVGETPAETRARLSKSPTAAAWLASVLTPFARHCFDGPAPMFVTSGNVRGTGKGLLMKLTATIAIGREPQFMTQATERDAEAEDRKRITGFAITGVPMIQIDNVRRPLGNGVLEAALTSTTWGERILGEQATPRSLLLATWYATGNNVLLVGDMARRCVMVRLDSPYARPEDREDVTEKNLEGRAKNERPALVAACLTLLRAWCARGMNDIRDPGPTGSYDGWSRIVRGAVIDALGADPWECRGSIDAEAEDDAPTHEKLLDGLAEALATMGKERATSDELISAMLENDEEHASKARASPMSKPPPLAFRKLRGAIAELIPGLAAGRLPNARQLGAQLRVHKNRPAADGRRIVLVKSGERFWSIQHRPAPVPRAKVAASPVPDAPAADEGQEPDIDIEREGIVGEGREPNE